MINKTKINIPKTKISIPMLSGVESGSFWILRFEIELLEDTKLCK